MLELAGAVLGILFFFLKKFYSKEGIERREKKKEVKKKYEAEKALVEGDSEAVGVRLSTLFHRVRKKNSDTSK